MIAALAMSPMSAPAAESNEPVEKMRVVYTPYDFLLDGMIAVENGYFKTLGLDFVPVTIEGGSAAIISTLQRGEIDGCFIASSSALVAVEKGIDLVQVAGVGDQTFDIYVLKDSPIQSLKDCEGRKIGNYPKPSGPWLALKYDLDRLKIKADVIDMKTEDVMVSALLSGQIDAAEGTSYMEAQCGGKIRKVHSCAASKYIYNSCGWWFKKQFVADHYGAVKRFVDGLLLGRLYITEHPDEAVKILAKSRKIRLEDLSVQIRLPRFDLPVTVYQFGLSKTNEIMREYGLIEKTLDVSKIVDPRFSLVVDQAY